MKNEKQKNPGFSIYQFKKWLDEHDDNGLPKLDLNKPKVDASHGSPVYSKVSDNKILEKMEDTNGIDKSKLLSEFKNSAIVVKSYGKRVTVLVESGTFTIPRFCVKIEKNKNG